MDSACIDGPLPGGGLYPNTHLNAPTYMVLLSLLLSLYFLLATTARVMANATTERGEVRCSTVGSAS